MPPRSSKVGRNRTKEGAVAFTNVMLYIIGAGLVVLLAFVTQVALEELGDPYGVLDSLPLKLPTKEVASALESRGFGKNNQLAKQDSVLEQVKEAVPEECLAGDQECLFKQKAAQIKEVKDPLGANEAGKPRDVSLNQCSDRHQQCKGFAEHGECKKNPGWMTINCPASCDSCDLLDHKVRCNRDRLGIPNNHVYAPGDMDNMFSEIEAKYGDQYGVNVLSTSPWVVTFDNFLTDVEITELIRSVNDNWERSTDTGTQNEFGETGRILSSSRTSNNAWCRWECDENPHVQNIVRKIHEITHVPTVNFESFQVLRYEIGQKYNTHHDASPQQAAQASGVRILTFFLYLSDVEEGGETAFPNLGIEVKPKKGSALLWPSVMGDDPNKIDGRTMHAAKPVIRGTKFAANTWIHSHDFSTSNLWGCTGTFDELTQ